MTNQKAFNAPIGNVAPYSTAIVTSLLTMPPISHSTMVLGTGP